MVAKTTCWEYKKYIYIITIYNWAWLRETRRCYIQVWQIQPVPQNSLVSQNGWTFALKTEWFLSVPNFETPLTRYDFLGLWKHELFGLLKLSANIKRNLSLWIINSYRESVKRISVMMIAAGILSDQWWNILSPSLNPIVKHVHHVLNIYSTIIYQTSIFTNTNIQNVWSSTSNIHPNNPTKFKKPSFPITTIHLHKIITEYWISQIIIV